MAAECAKQKGAGPHPPGNNRQPKVPKDVFAELSRAGYGAAYALALKARIHNLESRLVALEKHGRDEKTKQNKFVLRELVKEARARILEVNGIPPPSSKQSWKYCLHNLTQQQLQQANVNLKLWPDIVEILSPSVGKLNDWVHGYTTWQAARVIEGMNSKVQHTWAELFKITHRGESFEDYAKLMELYKAEELHEDE